MKQLHEKHEGIVTPTPSLLILLKVHPQLPCNAIPIDIPEVTWLTPDGK